MMSLEQPLPPPSVPWSNLAFGLAWLEGDNARWATYNFGSGQDGTQSILGALEELGELAHAQLKSAQGIRTNEDHDAAKEDAVADTVIYLIDYCNREGISFAEALCKTWLEVRRRDWKRFPQNGLDA